MKKIETIWIVDDDDIHQFFAKKTFEHLQIGREIKSFLFGADALLEIEKRQHDNSGLPDVILLDINMPLMDGWEFMEQFRILRNKMTKKIEILIVSSSIAEIDRQKATLFPEIAGFLIKPIAPSTLSPIFKKIFSV